MLYVINCLKIDIGVSLLVTFLIKETCIMVHDIDCMITLVKAVSHVGSNQIVKRPPGSWWDFSASVRFLISVVPRVY